VSSPTPEQLNQDPNQKRVSCFSLKYSAEADRIRYRNAAIGFCIAALLVIGISLGIREFLKKVSPSAIEVQPAFDAAANYTGTLYILGILFVVSLIFPFSKKLRHCVGTICNSISFLIIAAVMCFLVHGSGGLGSSLYGAPFLALISIALFVPSDRIIKILLFSITLVLGITLVIYTHPDKQLHDSIILALSVTSFGFAALIKSFLNWVL
jgi:hypothetical protein